MKIKPVVLTIIFLSLSLVQLGMGRNSGQYDEEARQQEREAREQAKAEKKAHKNPAQNIAEGVKQVTVGNADNYEVEEPEKGSGEPTKIKIKIPGT